MTDRAAISFWQAVTDPTNQDNVRAIQRAEREQVLKEIRLHQQQLMWALDTLTTSDDPTVLHREAERAIRFLEYAAKKIERRAA